MNNEIVGTLLGKIWVGYELAQVINGLLILYTLIINDIYIHELIIYKSILIVNSTTYCFFMLFHIWPK